MVRMSISYAEMPFLSVQEDKCHPEKIIERLSTGYQFDSQRYLRVAVVLIYPNRLKSSRVFIPPCLMSRVTFPTFLRTPLNAGNHILIAKLLNIKRCSRQRGNLWSISILKRPWCNIPSNTFVQSIHCQSSNQLY